MKTEKQSALSFLGMDIIDVNYNSNQPFDKKSEVNIGIDAKLVSSKEDKSHFKIFMLVKVSSETFFNLEVQALGNFELSEEMEEKQISDLISVNAPAIMFPYVRAFITSFTANCGASIIPIVLPPQFFSGKLEVL